MVLIILSEDFIPLILSAADSKNRLSIEAFIRDTFVSLIKTADPEVNRLFFPAESSLLFDKITLLTYEELSARYLLYVISGCRLCPDFAALVKEKSYRQVNDFLSFHAEPIGELFYRLYLNKYLSLPETASDRDTYFRLLAERLITTDFQAVTKAVSSIHSPAPTQLLLSALKLLDSGTYNTVLLAWAKSDFFSTEFADLDLLHLLEHYPWLQEYHTDLLSDNFMKGILFGIQKNYPSVKEWIEKGVVRYCLF